MTLLGANAFVVAAHGDLGMANDCPELVFGAGLQASDLDLETARLRGQMENNHASKPRSNSRHACCKGTENRLANDDVQRPNFTALNGRCNILTLRRMRDLSANSRLILRGLILRGVLSTAIVSSCVALCHADEEPHVSPALVLPERHE